MSVGEGELGFPLQENRWPRRSKRHSGPLECGGTRSVDVDVEHMDLLLSWRTVVKYWQLLCGHLEYLNRQGLVISVPPRMKQSSKDLSVQSALRGIFDTFVR